MITGWRRARLGIPTLSSNTDNTGIVSGLALFMIKAGGCQDRHFLMIINGPGPIAETPATPASGAPGLERQRRAVAVRSMINVSLLSIEGQQTHIHATRGAGQRASTDLPHLP